MGNDEESQGAEQDISLGSGSQPYNRVYETLVDEADEGADTLVGMIAYSLYKNAKREWVAEIRREAGRPPSGADLAA